MTEYYPTPPPSLFALALAAVVAIGVLTYLFTAGPHPALDGDPARPTIAHPTEATARAAVGDGQ